MAMASLYKDSPAIRAVDPARVRAATHGIPMHRSSRNSDTVSHVNHGSSTMGGGSWQAHKAAYEASTSAQMQREDRAHLGALRRHMQVTGMHPNAAAWVEHWIGQNHAYNPHLISFMRQIGSDQSKLEQERQVARDAERSGERVGSAWRGGRGLSRGAA